MTVVLITGAAGPAGAALGAQLDRARVARAGLVFIGADLLELDDPRYDAAVTVPRADAPDYAPAMRRLVAEHGVDLIVPTVQDELVALAGIGNTIGCRVAISAAGPVAISADKLITMWALADAGVAVPGHGSPADFADAEAAMAALGGPVVVKPRVSRGGRGVRLVESAGDLDWATLDATDVVQSFAPGTEYCPQVYRRGDEVVVVVLEKTALKEGRVGNAVSTVRREAGEVADVEALARDAVLALGLTGAVDLDIRREASGRPVVLEVNARFGANSAAAPELFDRTLDAELSGTSTQ